ncbi:MULTISPECIES: histidine kinase N-terminal domain-containing protein [Dictyoglomus]|jgi:two-component sensor histidine kinase|uniref:histidine kinase n=1 Tax=Dictyoglomus turgidum (strain DSM 6724 / Z-1310) TaxID=515635 RepID=B8E277_DICTD|nr:MULTISPECIES: histidine kinase N-terminal domain-containing protein [Dictyoglomus]ACK42354.1 signal transduction histidine kinase [Dictyoglomus turgidum DSM 6724]PNV80845.1 MAG: ethanolamine utilization protein [Dictyoglomus turgidum]HBU32190.1 ethanolamine utilization protein [Dictyoglomus sp.]
MTRIKKETTYLLEELKDYVPYLSLISDLLSADIYLYQPITDLSAVILIAEAHPKIVPPLSLRQEVGKLIFFEDDPNLFEVINTGKQKLVKNGIVIGGFPVEEEIYPIKKDNNLIGILKVQRNLLVHSEFPYNARSYKETSQWLIKNLIKFKLNWKGYNEPLTEGEGIMILDRDGIVLFANMSAVRLFRTLGEVGNIWGRKIKDSFFYKYIETYTETGIIRVYGEETYEEYNDETRSFYRRIFPLTKGDQNLWRVFYVIKETTELKQKERELKFKSVLIKEIHHRVKNNLQTIASLLRIQIRRLESESAKLALQESINRINSIAYVHESLSKFEEDRVDIVEVAEKLLNAFKQTYEHLPCKFNFYKNRKSVFLSSKKATSVSLIMNELLQNATKHGAYEDVETEINLHLYQENQDIIMIVENKVLKDKNVSFDISFTKGSLGFQLIQMLTEEIKGKIDIERKLDSLSVKIRFPKGEEDA